MPPTEVTVAAPVVIGCRLWSVMRRRRALFEAWRGRYSDSPRAVSELLGDVAPEVERFWVASDPTTFPQDVRCIPRHRLRHFAMLTACDALVTNDIVTKHLVKGPNVTYVQAWHGSPIKVVGLDEDTPQYRNGMAHRKRMLRDVAKWDYLLTNSKEYTRILRGAFGYEGEVLEVGYPRNDILVNDDGQRREKIRQRLGLRPEQRAVLYAPTWRDDAHREGGGFYQPHLIDWGTLDSLVPADIVILNKLHNHVVGDGGLPAGRVIDVSRYADVTDLILASDAMISDYSSIIYDYAITGRPIVLHAPDLDRYRDQVRSFYFDYESWAPGPITGSTEELADTLGSLDRVVETYADTYSGFAQKFCTFETGSASERVVATLLERGAL